MNRRVGFVGFGEAARVLAGGLNGRGPALSAYCNGPRHRPPYTEEFRRSAAARGVSLMDSLEGLVRGSDIIVSAVLPAAAPGIAREVARHLRAGQIFADINAVPPDAKEAMAAEVRARDARFVDAELMGAASLYGFDVPVYASGDGAEAFREEFAPVGLKVTVVPGAAGAAATLKVLRSIVTKGMEALIVEAMVTAFRAGLAREAFAAVTEPMDALKYSDFAKMCIMSDPLHSGRRADEMKSVADVVRRLGVEPIMTEATRRRLEWSASFQLKPLLERQPASDYVEVLGHYDRLDRSRSAASGHSVTERSSGSTT